MEITAGRRGLINGRGLVNGRGRVNGLINGSGFINGSSVAEPHLPRKNLAPRYLAIGASMIMLFAVATVFIPGSGGSGIQIDGSFTDWNPAAHYPVGTGSSNANVDLQSVSLELPTGNAFLFLRATVRGFPFDTANYDTMYAFLQTDSAAASGYAVAGLHADFMVRVSGSNRTVKDARILQYSPGGGSDDDWMGWRTIGGTIQTAIGGADPNGGEGQIEIAVPLDALTPLARVRASVAFDDNAGNTSRSFVPIAGGGLGSLVVTERGRTWVVAASGGPQVLMEIEFAAYGGPVSVTGLTSSLTPGATFGGLPGTPVDIPADTSRYFNVTVDPIGFSSGVVVRASLAAVDTSSPYVIVGPEGRAYVNAPPAGRRIDGLFRDWPLPRNDTNPARRPALDIRQYDGAVQGNDVYAYARLAGSALEGLTIPDRLLAPVAGGGGPGGNQTASMLPPPRFGEDTVRFYISTNASAPGGVPVNGLRVDRLLEVRGRDGSVTNASLFRWSGQSWRWEARAFTGLGDHEIEVNATVAGVSFNNTQIVAVTSDWAGVADITNAGATRSGTRGDPGLTPLDGSGTQTITAPPLTNEPTVDGSCGVPSDEYAGAASFTNGSFHFFVGRRSGIHRVYLCVEVSADGTNNAGDWAELLFDTTHNHTNNPQPDDRRFRENSQNGTFLKQKGDGSMWVDCGGTCDAPVAASYFNNSIQTYEFNISFLDVWGTNSPNTTQEAGFAIVAFNAATSATYWWGSDSVSDTNPFSWGHLDIPEFPESLAVSVATLAWLGMLRRRRFRSCRPPAGGVTRS